ncbi:flagellar export protein FliJ [Helicobacter baculiformis]|uniref:Flagellar FliJ protein n=1 Tax=Helicobacter baculiformis TaxID=427351 RepID=A0ABV7ZGL5_9HELI|nr:flagellar export protein FliJ [Helicobacter baculiformis]
MSQFKALLKIKRQAVQRAEIALANNRAQITHQEQELLALNAQLCDLSVPMQGGMHGFAQLNALKHNYRYALAQAQAEIAKLEQRAVQLQEAYRQASLEYEKISYLETLETQKELARLRRLEHKEMDAIGTSIFIQKQRSTHV